MITPKEIIRSRRRSIALSVNGQGELIVRAPYYVNNIDIMAFVAKKQLWLAGQRERILKEIKEIPPLTLEENAPVMMQGHTYYIAKRGVENITPFGDALLVPFDCTVDRMTVWLQEQLWQELVPRVKHFAQVMEVEYRSIQLSDAKSKWGSCSYRNALRFSWRLIFCPLSVVDYIVVHELTHIKNKSHNRLFWQQVAEVLPDYKNQEKWLKSHRKVMDIL